MTKFSILITGGTHSGFDEVNFGGRPNVRMADERRERGRETERGWRDRFCCDGQSGFISVLSSTVNTTL